MKKITEYEKKTEYDYQLISIYLWAGVIRDAEQSIMNIQLSSFTEYSFIGIFHSKIEKKINNNNQIINNNIEH